MIDTAQQVQTPEGVELNLSPAGPVVRGLAWAIDFFIRCLVYIAMAIVLIASLDEFGLGLFLIFAFFNEWFYPVYFEVKKHGRTPGKKAMGLRVLNDDGTPVTWGSSILRNLVMCVDMFPILYGLGLCCMLSNRRFKRLGDIAAGTVVVHAVEQKIGKTGSVPDEKPERPPLILESDEQKAIVAFAERVKDQTMPRNIELANILSDVTGEQGREGVIKLVAYANSIMGKK